MRINITLVVFFSFHKFLFVSTNKTLNTGFVQVVIFMYSDIKNVIMYYMYNATSV